MAHVSVEQIRLNYLRKQFLLSEDVHDFYTIAKTHLGLHSTDYWSPYLSVFARCGDYDAAKVYQALNRGQQLARIHAFRGAVHVVHQDNLPLVIGSTGPRLYRMVRKSSSLRDVSDQKVELMLEKFLAALEDQPLRMRELKQALPELAPVMRSLLYLGMATGQVVRATTPHARSTLSTYSLMKHWFPHLKMQQHSEEEAIIQLIRRYIGIFGPVSVNDIAWWLPTTKKQAKTIITEYAHELVAVDIIGDTKYMTKTDFEIIQTLSSGTEPIIRFLPYEDYFAKAFIERSWFIDPELQPSLFPRAAKSYWPEGATPKRAVSEESGVNQSGEIRPSIWLDGQIIGRWEFGESEEGFTIAYDLYTHIHQNLKARIREQQKQLEEFVNTQLLPISIVRKD